MAAGLLRFSMGSFPVTRGVLRDELGDIVGVRTGLAWSESRLDPFIDNVVPELQKGATGVRMRASEFKGLVFSVLNAAGDQWTSMGYSPRMSTIKEIGQRRYVLAADLLHQEMHHQGLGDEDLGHDQVDCQLGVPGREPDAAFRSLGMAHIYAAASLYDMFVAGGRLADLDDDLFLGTAMMRHGRQVRDDCAAMLRAYRCEQHLDPWGQTRRETAADLLDLSDLFEKSAAPCPNGSFIDQRFIDYLYANLDCVSRIHWRQFERLVAEYLCRQGYFVELGPGGNDDGVDIRMWADEPEPGQSPLVIVQCKRQRSKIEKVIVKALWADIGATSSLRGLVATTSTLTPGAASTIKARGYGIDVADYDAICQWLTTMRTPGTGITLDNA